MHVVVVGGGIIGLAVARELTGSGCSVTLLEKEDGWARHQTGHNSGVVHSGLYYRPGSLKAELCVAGASSITEYARSIGVPVKLCGKLVLATRTEQLPALAELARRGEANGVPVRRLEPAEARWYEPEVRCVGALRVASTAVVDFAALSRALVRELGRAGADLRLGAQVVDIAAEDERIVVCTEGAEIVADALVNCAGLHSDRVARLAGLEPAARIVPFRGEYHSLTPHAADLVRGLIYPVPDPRFPFLGVHLTRGIDGSVHAGPNAVLATAREGYRWRDVAGRDVADVLSYPGFWRLARHHLRTGIGEVGRSVSRARFATALAELVPAILAEDLEPAAAGVRAQAVARDGSLVDDFLLQTAPRQVHVLNAPSPAATSALEIAKHVVAELAAVAHS